MKIKHYLITAVLTYSAFLIYLVPASPLLNLMTQDNQGIITSSVTGSLWNGQAKSLQINHQNLEDINWSFIPWRLFIGEIIFDVQASYKDNPVSSIIGTSLTGKLLAHNLTATISAHNVGKLFDIPIGDLDGAISLNIKKASWITGEVPKIAGEINWKKAAVIIADRAELGDLTIVISESDTSPLLATIQNTGGQLDIKGNVSTDDTGQYKMNITLKPTTTANVNLRNSLKYIAKRKPNGNFEINNAGKLSSFGIM